MGNNSLSPPVHIRIELLTLGARDLDRSWVQRARCVAPTLSRASRVGDPNRAAKRIGINQGPPILAP
jgi:hypothetical protein